MISNLTELGKDEGTQETHVKVSKLVSVERSVCMNHIDKHITEPSSLNRDEKVEPGELLDESWFFGNLLDRKLRMSGGCHSDCPSSSPNYSGRTMESIGKQSSVKDSDFVPRAPGLIRVPSLPPVACLSREEAAADEENESRTSDSHGTPSALPVSMGREDGQDDEESEFALSRLIRQASISDLVMLKQEKLKGGSRPKKPTNNLLRTATLPSNMDWAGVVDQGCSPFAGRKVARQASLNPSNTFPARQTSNKGLVQTCRRARIRPEKIERMNARKSSSDGESEETAEGLQEKKWVGPDEDCEKSGPKDSGAWAAASAAQEERLSAGPPIPEDDMKEQIKFWARAVASNVPRNVDKLTHTC